MISQVVQPKIITIKRRQNQGFGFTLRHFIAYPPEPWPGTAESFQKKAMETIFIKEVHPNGPAFIAGLKTGDRILAVNNTSVAGISYSSIVSIIKQTPNVLKLEVVPKECDILQMYYTDIAHNPETNRRTIDIDRPLMPITSATTNTFHNTFNSRLISYSPEGQSSAVPFNHHQTFSYFQNSQKSIYSFGSDDIYLEEFPLRPKQQDLSVLKKPSDDEFMVRLRKSIEQKEEFLKQPCLSNDKFQQLTENISTSGDVTYETVEETRKNMSQNSKINDCINEDEIINKISKSNISKKLCENNSLTQHNTEISEYGKNINKIDGHTISAINQKEFLSNKITKPTLNLDESRFSEGVTVTQRHQNIPQIDRKMRRSSFEIDNSNKLKYVYNDHDPGSTRQVHKIKMQDNNFETFPDEGIVNRVFESKLVSHTNNTLDSFSILQNNSITNETKSNYEIEIPRKKNLDEVIDEINFYEIDKPNPHQNKELVYNNVSNCNDENIFCKNSLDESNKFKYLSQESLCESNDEVLTMKSDYAGVKRRTKKKAIMEETKPMRRISYLRATNNEICDFQNESAYNGVKLSIENKSVNICETNNVPENFKQKDTQSINQFCLSGSSKENENELDGPDFYETDMELKSSSIMGKRIPEYRSWRQAKISINGDILKIYLVRSSKVDNSVIHLKMKDFIVTDETSDKKKFVFRLQSKAKLDFNEYTDVLFKTKHAIEKKKMFYLLQQKCRIEEQPQNKQLAEPQKIAANTSIPTYCEKESMELKKQTSLPKCLEAVSTTTILGSSTFVNETGIITVNSISPLMKSRKANVKSYVEKELGSPKSKNWKDLLFRRIHSSNSSEISTSNTSTTLNRYVGSIGVPLKLCPMSKNNEFLPMIVETCTRIVETKGLHVVGIYRIPGNKAGISELKEEVNKINFQWDSVEQDERWHDVNVVSSLLKLFIRSLPDALLPGNTYINFIEADKKLGENRLKELYYLLRDLPRYSYETMKHLIRHLNRVSGNCHINLMEPKNLAIIFGPSIIRIPNETLDMAVKDMKHQCRIVELLVSQYDYFFENGEFPKDDLPLSTSTSTYLNQTNLLLDNVSKIEHKLHDKDSITSRFIPHLKKRSHGKRNVGSDTYSGESVLSLENKKIIESSTKESISNGNNNTIINKNIERGSMEISIILTDEDSSNSRSETGSMSLTTITDALDSKLRNLRSGSESGDDASQISQNKLRRTLPQPLNSHENIPFADESPEHNALLSSSCKPIKNSNDVTIYANVHSKNILFPSRLSSLSRESEKNSFGGNRRFYSLAYDSCSDDSEVSTTSDPKEAVISPHFTRYKKRRDYRLFRSASFNCRNYTLTRGNNTNKLGSGGGNSCDVPKSQLNNLTKDEKTDMNLTKKRQLQNKQNRSIKRRHTVGGPHDYSAVSINRKSLNSKDRHILEVGIRITNTNRRN